MSEAFPNDLRSGRYKAIVVDPPWNQGKTGRRRVRPNQNTQLDYPTLTKQQLMELPIQDWANPERAYLWLWATNSKDRNSKEPVLAMAFQLMDHWGFNYYTTITWDKGTGPCPFGPYQITTEHALFGYRGKGTLNTRYARQAQNLLPGQPRHTQQETRSFLPRRRTTL